MQKTHPRERKGELSPMVMHLKARNGLELRVPSSNWLSYWITFYLLDGVDRETYERGILNDGFFVTDDIAKKFAELITTDCRVLPTPPDFSFRFQQEMAKTPFVAALELAQRQGAKVTVNMFKNMGGQVAGFAARSGGFEIW
jgi:hypothetical protein